MRGRRARRSSLTVVVASLLAVAAAPVAAERKGPPVPHPGNANPGTGNPQQASKGSQGAHRGQGNAFGRRGKPQPAGHSKARGKGDGRAGHGRRAHGAPSKAAPRRKSRGTSTRGRSHAAKGATPRSEHARAGKTTICHATGSETNPYVRITVSNNALAAHRRHQDGRDVVPAQNGECPAAANAASAQGVRGAAHNAAAGLEQAAKPGAPAAGAPAASRGAPGPGAGGPAAGGPAGQNAPAAGGPAPGDGQQVAGVQESNEAAGPQPAAQVRALDDGDGGSLPFTGGDLVALAIAGAAALLAGVSLRRALRTQR